MSEALTFLPFLRRGLVQAIGALDDTAGSLAGGPGLTASVGVEGRTADMTVRLLGPESVTAVAASQILRAEPRPDSTGVEPNYFPFVELATPDLPWMLTPARASAGRLRPWLVLVVVREQEAVSLSTPPGAGLPVLRTPIAELPDLAESWAWAHVQSLVPPDEIEAALRDRTGEVVARLVCPRRLAPGCGWLACVVPAFAAGRLRGLGRAVARGTVLEPAWVRGGEGEIDLPVYYSWRFSTGPAGDFEALCRRLKRDGDAAEVGRHPMEVGDPGLISPAAGDVLVDMPGALETPGAGSRPWDATYRATFAREITVLLNAAAARPTDDPDDPDPVVAPPFYGSGPTGAMEVPAAGWLREVNDGPVARAAAGLGVAVVRAGQEALVAAAWDQAGQLRATATALNQARLGAEVAESWLRRAARLDDPDLLQLSAPMHAFLPTGSTTVRATLAASAVPGGLFSAAYLRQTRPGTPLARRWSAPGATGSGRLAADHAAITLAATSARPRPGDVAAIHFADHAGLDGAQGTDPALTDVSDPELAGEPSQTLRDEVTSLLRLPPGRLPPRSRPPARTRPPVVVNPPSTPDVSGMAATVRRVLDPMGAVRAALVVRIPALDGRLGDGPVPTGLALSPVFEDPLSDDLTRLGPAWMLPGAETIARNRVRLVAANPRFIGAFLVGANHELERELLWRGYPVAPAATFFHRFWNYTDDPSRIDIGELAGWERELSVQENMAGDTAGEAAVATVIVVRGDLVRRYPSAHYFLQAAELGDHGPVPRADAAPVEPVFLGALSPDTVFFGFDLEPRVVRGDRPAGDPGYLVAIEEQPGAPRLGLDVERDRHFSEPPASWNQLSWGHLVASREELEELTHARADSARLTAMGPLEGITWGRNSAHLARACWQRPFRMYIHADTLI
ncbi:hypothetical protein ACRYCC_22390 [Actinomadura scrupuli]|uniref:hypothetical protein n=1 Tax=Actinomadura scrupuli TaxID=559629 RepID=UPI003D99680F